MSSSSSSAAKICFPMHSSTWRAISRWAEPTASVAVQTVIPCPIWAGVLGMARTAAAWSSLPVRSLRRAPATIDRTSAPVGIPPGVLRARPASFSRLDAHHNDGCSRRRRTVVGGRADTVAVGKFAQSLGARTAGGQAVRVDTCKIQQAMQHGLRHHPRPDECELLTFEHRSPLNCRYEYPLSRAQGSRLSEPRSSCTLSRRTDPGEPREAAPPARLVQ